MQRVRIPGGRLTARQWRALAGIAREHCGVAGLHLTTRQDLEVHGLSARAVPVVQAQLAQAGLSALGACGDTLRNVTVCPGCDLACGVANLLPLALQIQQQLQRAEGIFQLPRKFKISLSGCGRCCGQPWINDLGLIARRRQGQWGFEVIVAGSLGVKPAAGIRLTDFLPAGDALAMAAATVAVFAEHGDRQNRRRARLRHVRQRLGDEAFKALLLEALRLEKSRTWPAVQMPPAESGFDADAVLSFPNGQISPTALEALAELADDESVRLRIATPHRLRLFARGGARLAAAVAHPALRAAALPQPAIVACPGTRCCSRALTDTNRMADRIREELAADLPADLAVCISGCPNGCAHSTVADIGLVGVVTTRDGVREQAYDLYGGGGNGRNDQLAEPLASKLTPGEAIAFLRKQGRRPGPPEGN